MKRVIYFLQLILYILWISWFIGCNGQSLTPSQESINNINLIRGDVVMCNSGDKSFGTVEFITSCSPEIKKDFDLAVALLHSFEYDEAEKVFAKIIDKEPECAMAYWGVAMSNYHQVWPSPPTEAQLEKGSKAISIAQTLRQKSKIETEYINTIAQFYKDWATIDHRTRSLNFAKTMEELYQAYPDDKEVAVFYALSLVGSADLADRSYRNQKKAGDILNALYPNEPDHPGIVHYIIHSYDSPELAELALPAARKYAAIAPSSAHAQHMPSHIFIRLGLWDESIASNKEAAASAVCYAENAGIKGHWDEEFHCIDYLVYAHLQKGENDLAQQQNVYIKSIEEVHPESFKVAYAYAAAPSRYLLENKMWKEAASLEIYPADFPWEKFPWQKAIFHFTRLLGSVHINQLDSARLELKNLNTLHDVLVEQKDTYKANQVLIQMKTSEAWILFAEGKNNAALQLMNEAAEIEDKTEKAPVTPGEVLPAKELLADMLLQLNNPAAALTAYEANLKKRPNRFNSLYGAGLTAEKSGNPEKAYSYYQQLTNFANSSDSNRPELEAARLFLKKQSI